MLSGHCVHLADHLGPGRTCWVERCCVSCLCSWMLSANVSPATVVGAILVVAPAFCTTQVTGVSAQQVRPNAFEGKPTLDKAWMLKHKSQTSRPKISQRKSVLRVPNCIDLLPPALRSPFSMIGTVNTILTVASGPRRLDHELRATSKCC